MKKFFLEVFRLLGWAQPSYVSSLTQRATKDAIDPIFEADLKAALESRKPLIVLFGEWGSGKTFQLLCFKKKYCKQYLLSYRSFFGISNAREASAHTLSPTQRWLSTIALLALAIFIITWLAPCINAFTPAAQALWVLAIFIVSSLLVTNHLRALYIAGTALWTLVRNTGRRYYVVLLDDLERSSLNRSDIWGLASTLWSQGQSHILPLGYGDDDEKLTSLEIAQKLGAHIITLHSQNHQKLLILDASLAGRQELNPFVFEKSAQQWLDFLSVRDLIASAEEILSRPSMTDRADVARILIAITTFRSLLKKLRITKIEEKRCVVLGVRDNRLAGHVNQLDSKVRTQESSGAVETFIAALSGPAKGNIRYIGSNCAVPLSTLFISEGLYSCKTLIETHLPS